MEKKEWYEEYLDINNQNVKYGYLKKHFRLKILEIHEDINEVRSEWNSFIECIINKKLTIKESFCKLYNDLKLGHKDDFENFFKKYLKKVEKDYEQFLFLNKPKVKLPGNHRRVIDFSIDVGACFKNSLEIFYKPNEDKLVEIGEYYNKVMKKDITVFKEISTSRFLNLIEKNIMTFSVIQSEEVNKTPSKIVAEIVMCNDYFIKSLYNVNRFLRFPLPFIIDDNFIIPKKGYDERFDAIFTSDTPKIDLMKVEEAKKLINKILGGFCFKEEIDKVMAISYLLTPACRGLYSRITCRTPLFMIKANRPGVGKDYLAGVVGILYEGSQIDDSPISDGSKNQTNEELRKKITSGLIQGRRRFHSSNNKGFLNNSILEQMLTSEHSRDRILGKNKEVELDNEIDFSLSANWGLTYPQDLWRRSRPINLFYSKEDINNREYQIEDLHSYIKENRDKILSAIITLINDWFENGMIPGKTKFSSYPEWARVVGGIMQHHKLGDPCIFLEDDGVGGDKETEDMKILFNIMFEISKGMNNKSYYLPNEIMNIISEKQEEYSIFSNLDLSQTGGRTSIGKKLIKFVGRELNGILLKVDNSNQRKSRWKYTFINETPKVGNFGNFGNIISVSSTKTKQNNGEQAKSSKSYQSYQNKDLIHQKCSICGLTPCINYSKIGKPICELCIDNKTMDGEKNETSPGEN